MKDLCGSDLAMIWVFSGLSIWDLRSFRGPEYKSYDRPYNKHVELFGGQPKGISTQHWPKELGSKETEGHPGASQNQNTI